MERLNVYVDGFNLYHGLHERAQCRWLWLDLVKLAENLRPKSSVQLVRYYTADVLNDREAQSRQRLYQNALEAHNGPRLEIIHGRYQSKQRSCRACGATWRVHEEKETDVNIAVGLVKDAALGAMDSALLISADSDLAPAVRAARQLQPDMFIAAAFPPERFSAELKALMPASFHIGAAKIRSALLPESVTDGIHTFDRPPKWAP